jgi:EAL domain-containing protein (putative c-di-GMP-specific phosphodiesterase class I)
MSLSIADAGAQGYFLARPLDPDAATAWLADRSAEQLVGRSPARG